MIKTICVAVLAALTLHAHAETRLRPVITASRVAQSADQTLTAVTVIDAAQIAATRSQSLPEVLRLLVPGLDFSTTGGVGHQVSAFLRGTSSDNVLVLVDGNIIGSATTGAAALELLPLRQIERIEVVRGPRSSLYGSDAIGGIIQVFTRRADDDSASASLTLGARNTRATDATLGLGSADYRYTISADALATDGFDVTNDGETDADGYTSRSLNLKFTAAPRTGTLVELNALNAVGETEFDNRSFDNDSDSVQQNIGIGIDQQVSPAWSMGLDLGHTRDRLETRRNTEDFFTPGNFNAERTLFETRRGQARWTNRVSFGQAGLISTGVDYLDDEVISTTTYAVNQRSNSGLYALVQDKFGSHHLQLSGRVDDNEAFGVHRTYGAAWSWDIDGSVSAGLSRSSAFIAPTFNDLYFVDPFFIGNPGLQPEASHTTEAALTGTHHLGAWELRLYRTEIEDLVVNVSSDPADPLAPFTTTNAARARIDGAEIVLAADAAGWNNSFSFAYVDAADESTGRQLQNRARRTLKLRTGRTLRGHEVSLDLLAQGPRFADVANTQALPGYGIVNLAVSRALSAHWRFSVKLENLLDKAYTTSTDFFANTTNNPPRSLYLSLDYRNGG